MTVPTLAKGVARQLYNTESRKSKHLFDTASHHNALRGMKNIELIGGQKFREGISTAMAAASKIKVHGKKPKRIYEFLMIHPAKVFGGDWLISKYLVNEKLWRKGRDNCDLYVDLITVANHAIHRISHRLATTNSMQIKEEIESINFDVLIELCRDWHDDNSLNAWVPTRNGAFAIGASPNFDIPSARTWLADSGMGEKKLALTVNARKQNSYWKRDW